MFNKLFSWIALATVLSFSFLTSCRNADVLPPSEKQQVQDSARTTSVKGFYLLNQGNMGSNKTTLDYYDLATGVYTLNLYSAVNPSEVMSMGDLGNDLKIYGNRMYVTVNGSNVVEVMDARTAKHIGTIAVPNCRYLCFSGRYGFVSSYAGPVLMDDEYKQRGYIAKFDTATLNIVDTCHVGFQPDGVAVAGIKLYVANSGGYLMPNYETTVSVIDIATMKELHRIGVNINLNHLCTDRYGQLWVTSSGDYVTRPSKLYCIDTATDCVTDSVDLPAGGMWLAGDSLYTEASYYYSLTGEYVYGILNVRTHEVVTRNFISDGTDKDVMEPYGIAVHPKTGDIYLMDAKTYVVPGALHCYDRSGRHKWTVRTGDIPVSMAFLTHTK